MTPSMISRKRMLAGLLAVASLAIVSAASADETVKPGTITLKPTTVVGSYKRPSVVIEVARAKPEIKLADLADPAVEKIVRAATKSPF
ncbi:MAG: hypothetical protein JWO86_3774 [Myxococcaceae bacterium]|nr:hypothetical protein [Myxococcaceae bacterium]MEA2751037.1 hypothetical protein [Myxococcales bacterium]